MSVVDDLERRLENWARWSGGAGVGAFGVASIYGFGAFTSHYSDEAMPVINGEALDTETAIRKLDGPPPANHDPKTRPVRPLEDALRARYQRVATNGGTGERYRLGTDASEIDVAAALYLSYDTYLRRLRQARTALLEQMRADRESMLLKNQA